jgi:orotate phosphoribosyltransferase
MLPATILALHLNCDLIDVDGFVNERVFNRGHSRIALSEGLISTVDSAKSILVLDDSVYSGKEMANVRKRLAPFGVGKNIIFAAVYVSSESKGKVDFYFRVIPNPRVFEWNLMHHQLMGSACIDMDGVLCRDPTEAENDDGSKYQEFLVNAEPFLVPKVPVGYIVTSRLEKYRQQTELWLSRHNVRYKQLIMMNLPSKKARVEMGNHALYKANECKRVDAKLFIESDEAQAIEIANKAVVDVYCVKTQRWIHPSLVREKVAIITQSPARFKRITSLVFREAKKLLKRFLL